MTTTKSFFAVDFFKNTITGTKAAFDKASKGKGAHYEELTRLMAQHPDFKLVIKKQKIQKAKKQTYEGLDFDLMKRYLSIQDNAEELIAKYEGSPIQKEKSKMLECREYSYGELSGILNTTSPTGTKRKQRRKKK